jgi:sulfur relay (sulfurtransferase) complex TusBCD TusD component (DsrE family)
LLAEGSAVLDAIEMLAKKGIGITACGTCVSHYQLHNLIDPVQIGNMVGIIAELMVSDHVVTV